MVEKANYELIGCCRAQRMPLSNHKEVSIQLIGGNMRV